jgi:mannose-6-phosphate isomerase-like protein (cupin superfamily)
MTESVRNEYPWGVLEWLAGAEVGNSEELSIARMWLMPDHETDAHLHNNCEESVYVLTGELECLADGVSLALLQGEHSVVPRGSVHTLRNVGAETAELLLSYSSAERAFELAAGT